MEVSLFYAVAIDGGVLLLVVTVEIRLVVSSALLCVISVSTAPIANARMRAPAMVKETVVPPITKPTQVCCQRSVTTVSDTVNKPTTPSLPYMSSIEIRPNYLNC